MGNGIKIDLLIFQVVIIFLLIVVIAYLVRINYSLKLERKFSNYTVKRLNNNTVSIFDKLFGLFDVLIKRISKALSKSSFIINYSKRYEKHIYYDDLDNRCGLDFISAKLIIGVLITLIYITSSVFQYNSINLLSFVFSFIVGYYSVDVYLKIKSIKRKKEISDDLLKSIMIMNNAFKSGKSITQAIKTVAKELDGAIKDEFKRMSLDLSYGLSIEVAFERFYERVQLEDAKYITTSLIILNKTGGNIIKVFDSIEKEFINRKKLQHELKSLTSSSVFVFRLLLFMPFLLFVIIYILNPGYFVPLITTSLGYIILSVIIIIYILYILLIKKILRIDL